MMAAVVPEAAEEQHAGWQDQVVPNLPDNNGSKQSPPDSRCKSTIFLVRHGDYFRNLGSNSLTPKGNAQAHRAGKFVAGLTKYYANQD